jgi:acetylornithine/N-succinyldiaminopimelate aminotransferase
MTEAVAQRLEPGDHGGTYCGNPLGCAVAQAVIQTLLDDHISDHVAAMGDLALRRLSDWKGACPERIMDVRGQGLLLAIEFCDQETATRVSEACLAQGLFIRQTQGTMIRIFPALNIKDREFEEGLSIIQKAIEALND